MPEEEVTEFYRRFRPSNLKEVIGQTSAVRTLSQMIRKNSIPHAILFSGPSGAGKTTMARILKDKLNCHPIDYKEVNCGTLESPLDTVRDIQATVNLSPFAGGHRIWLMEECFYKDTLVSTSEGQVPISSIKKGNIVYNQRGRGRVVQVFKNKVPISRLVKLTFSNGKVIYTTKDHKFYTNRGWIEAQYLRKQIDVFTTLCHSMGSQTKETSYGSEMQREEQGNLCLLQKGISYCRVGEEKGKSLLLQEMCSEFSEHTAEKVRANGVSHLSGDIYEGIWEKNISLLRSMQEKARGRTQSEKEESRREEGYNLQELRDYFSGLLLVEKSILFQSVPGKMANGATRNKEQNSQSAGTKENTTITCRVQENRRVSANVSRSLRENEKKESFSQSEYSRENKNYKGKEWNSSYLEREKRRKWDYNQTTEKDMGSSRRDKEWMVLRSSNFNRVFSSFGFWIPVELQSRYWEREAENSNRNRWIGTSFGNSPKKGQEETGSTREIRLESIEVYQQGSGSNSFRGIVQDRDISRGYVEFFDLEVEGDHSYFAEEILVHNCQALSRARFAQEALLLVLENIPSHAYFFLCTTEPRKLLNTVRSRCTNIVLKAHSRVSLEKILREAADKAKIQVSEDIVDRIIEHCEGNARNALVFLHQISEIELEEDRLEAICSTQTNKQAYELFGLLLNSRTKWPEIARVLSAIDDDPEQVRRLMLSCASSAMIKGGRTNLNRVYRVIHAFESPFFDSGQAGLIRACFEVNMAPE